MTKKSLGTPRKWQYTWEAQSHSPTLRLFLFNLSSSPLIRCKSLRSHLILSQSQLLVTWIDETEEEEDKGEEEVSLRVPIPRVLVDSESTVNIRALDDHIEVKLALLLPVDHPIVSSFDSVLNSSDNGGNVDMDTATPIVLDSDLKRLSSMEGVHFYCRNCSTRLTRSPLRNFAETPSVNWREVTDNWFGTCCCSFGGVTEKLVAKYAKSYGCAKGLCLLNVTSVVLCKDDLEECRFSKLDGSSENGYDSVLSHHDVPNEGTIDLERILERGVNFKTESVTSCHFSCDEEDNTSKLNCGKEMADFSDDEDLVHGCCVHERRGKLETSLADLKIIGLEKLTSDKESLLNGYLENIFMARASNLSKNIQWIEFVCPQCSSLLGAYPSCDGDGAPIDGGIRLFKCYISTSSPAGGSSDIFRKYTLERMFTNQLVESAKDELSFRIIVKDLTMKRPMVQVVLLNPNSWRSTGHCSSEESSHEPASRADMSPVAKVLFSDCSNTTELQLRVMERTTKDFDDEVFIFKSQAEELIRLLVSAHEKLPSACAYLQGFSVSSMRR